MHNDIAIKFCNSYYKADYSKLELGFGNYYLSALPVQIVPGYYPCQQSLM